MERATKNKKSVRNLDDVNKMQKQEMDQFFGGNTKSGKKKKRFFGGWFSLCEGDLPQ